MQLTGEQAKQLHGALLSAFPKVAPLQILVRTGLNENLATIAGETDLSTMVFALIQWAEANGRTVELIEKATHENPGNPELRRFAEQFVNPTLVPPPSNDLIPSHENVRYQARADTQVAPVQERFDYDVFLCNHPKDRQVVRAIAERLRGNGVRVWFDEW